MMKRHLLLIGFAMLWVVDSNAQKGENFLKIHAGAEITTGFFGDTYNTGWGIYATDYYQFNENTSAVISSGVAGWKTDGPSPFKAGMSLTRLGLRQFISAGFYMQGDAGIAIGLQSFSGPTRFTFGGGPGYLIKNKNGGGVDFSARINRAFYRTWIGVGAGYQFKL